MAETHGKAGEERRRGPEKLGEILERVLRDRGLFDAGRRREIAAAWEEVAGPLVSAGTRVASLRGGVLVVEVLSSALRQELETFRKEELLDGIRERFAREYVRDLRFRLV